MKSRTFLASTLRHGLPMLILSGLAACSSSGAGEAAGERAAEVSQPAPVTGQARTSLETTPRGERLTQEQIRTRLALGETVFYFDFDEAELGPNDRQTLLYHARDLAANPRKRIRLEGHADERGSREYNLALGERRASSVLDYLLVNGAARSQIDVVSYGEERPAASGDSERAHARNRRVEVVSRS